MDTKKSPDFIAGIKHAAELITQSGWNNTFTNVNEREKCFSLSSFLQKKAERYQLEIIEGSPIPKYKDRFALVRLSTERDEFLIVEFEGCTDGIAVYKRRAILFLNEAMCAAIIERLKAE